MGASFKTPLVILSLAKDQFSCSFFRMKDFFVYVLSGNSMVLYVGVTSDLEGRIFEHRVERNPKSFVARYNLDRLVYCESFPTALEAIAYEKKLKGWSREKKKRLIRTINPMWKDLAAEWYSRG